MSFTLSTYPAESQVFDLKDKLKFKKKLLVLMTAAVLLLSWRLGVVTKELEVVEYENALLRESMSWNYPGLFEEME